MSSARLGGAHNTSTFRKIVERGFIPDKKSITFEGLFQQYFFDFGGEKEVNSILEPLYSVAHVEKKNEEGVDKYIGVSLVSSEDGKDYREPLNCVVVLDISGSMGSFFDVDYNDGPIYQEIEGKFVTTKKTKMEIANECLLELSRTMKDDENFGVILFDEKIDILQPLRTVGSIDREKLEQDISNIQPRGGTNMEIGMRKAIEMLEENMKEGKEGEGPKNNRIIFLTDACPNEGGGSEVLKNLSREAATKHHIFSTFIGIGLDFNSELIDDLGKIMGSNYFSVHSKKEFQKILNDDFNYMVTPIAHNCVLSFDSKKYEIERCYGTPHGHHSEENKILMSIQTVSASPKSASKGVKGGIIVIQLKQKEDYDEETEESDSGFLSLEYDTVSMDNRKKFGVKIMLGRPQQQQQQQRQDFFENNGIRKAVLLVTFCKFMHHIIDKVKKDDDNREQMQQKLLRRNKDSLSEDDFQQLKEFKRYFLKELEVVGDNSLGKELDIIDRMIYRK